MKPAIGLNCDLALHDARPKLEIWQSYTAAVELAGGTPVLLPVSDNPAHIDEQLDIVDGLVLIGGKDYDPELYGAARHEKTEAVHPARQFYDLELARAAIRRKVPILAICGGCQLVNIVCGGDLTQHLPDILGAGDPHTGKPEELVHEIDIEPGSMLARIVGTERMAVNSTHHQAAKKIGGGLQVVARSPGGVIEALESKGDAFLLCVQWHPERLAADHPRHLALIAALVEASLEQPGLA